VAGNPARLIRKRFDDETISLLGCLAWWDKTPSEIEQIKELFFVNFNDKSENGLSMLKSYLDGNK
jgi:virginiamycin A acetyltransferase